MAETLYGPWALEVIFGEANSGERFTITGSDSADGVYDKRLLMVNIGTVPATVTGAQWTITFEFSPLGFADIGQVGPFVMGDWYASGIVKSATYNLKDHLVVSLSANYSTQPNYAARPDYGQRGLIIRCQSLDPALRAGTLPANPYDFTLPRETITRFYQTHTQTQTPKPERQK